MPLDAAPTPRHARAPLTDPFGRTITYLRVSVTDRCDFRCVHAAIDEAIARKPKGHDFVIDRDHQRPAVARHMSVTGG
jgi:molybdenum cofactor biosynthesis enzyme MoaA